MSFHIIKGGCWWFWFRFVSFDGISTIVGYLMTNLFLYIQTVLFQAIQFSISTQVKCQKHFYFKQFSSVNKVKCFQVLLCITNYSIKHQSFIFTQFNVKTVLFQTIQFIISTQFSSIYPINRTLSGATTPGQSGPGSDGNKGVLHIPQSSSITGASPSDCLVSYPGHPLRESYTSVEIQSGYSTAPADWATMLVVLQLMLYLSANSPKYFALLQVSISLAKWK